jgi:hypothetical protein
VSSSIPGLVNSLNYWLTQQSSRTTRNTLKYHNPSVLASEVDDMISNLSDLFGGPNIRNQNRAAQDALQHMSDDMVIQLAEMSGAPTKCPGPKSPRARAEWLLKARDVLGMMANNNMERGNIPPPGLEIETVFYEKFRAFVPPPGLREGGLFAEIWMAFREAENGGNKIERKLPKGAFSKVFGRKLLIGVILLTTASSRLAL